VSADLDAWLRSAAYLPPPLRDFHDQKDVFKAMHAIIKEDPAALIKRPDWVAGQCYVIDVFLWFMARRGYTLQRTRKKLPFRDLQEDVDYQTRRRENEFCALLKSAATPPPQA
jgi:hypothetical protein